jgi:hypothetical protein
VVGHEKIMAVPSLYRRILGARFDDLPATLRRFHDADGGGRAHGTFQIVRGTGWMRNAIASLLGMLQSGADVPVRLHVATEGARERWTRDFGGHRVETVQWARGDALLEAIGPACFSCALVLDGTRLWYEFRRAWFAGIPIPRWLSPGVESYVDAGEAGWFVVVRVLAPFLSEIVRYEGWMEPE